MLYDNIPGLTLTWDVFKFGLRSSVAVGSTGLTLTWDVFKWKRTKHT